MLFDLKEVLIELKRRERMALDIDAIIQRRFAKDIRNKLRRGKVQGLVAEDLGVTMSSRLSTLINERMALLGFPKCILHGNAFYRHVTIKKPEILAKI